MDNVVEIENVVAEAVTYAVVKDNKVTSMVHSEKPTGLNLEGCTLVESDIDVVGMVYVDGEFVEDKSAEELAIEAQTYLDSTDYIYLSQKEKGLSDDEVAEKYADIITKRIEQRAIISEYQDSLTTV